MAASSYVPEVINNFNCYTNGEVLVGVTDQVTLPTLEAITEEIGGAGILGTYDASIPGFYSSISQEIPFRIMDKDIFSLMAPDEPVELTFRAAAQSTIKATGALDYKQMRIVERGRLKSFTPGSLEIGKKQNASVTLELLYILIENDGKTMLEYDKLNSVFVVNDKDLLEKIREYC